MLSPLAAEQIFNEALNAFQSGNLADAALKADRLIASASVSSQLFHFRGLIEINQLNFNAAIRFFREGLAIEPNSTKLSDSMGTALSEMGQLDDAIASYRRALLNDTRNAGALMPRVTNTCAFPSCIPLLPPRLLVSPLNGCCFASTLYITNNTY